MMPPGLGRAAERRSDPEPERRGSRGREEHPVRTLDELFRKTTAKPCIYWLPLTDEQVAEKKRKAAVAAEQQKQPAANGSAEKK
jgi:apoptotic chromatin condensation inducer in the nucleus